MKFPDDVMQKYAGVHQYDWAAKLLDPQAHASFENGDGFDRLQHARRLMESRHIAATIIRAAREAAFEEAAVAAKLQALISGGNKRRTKRFGLIRDPYPHEIGNEIAAAIRGLQHKEAS